MVDCRVKDRRAVACIIFALISACYMVISVPMGCGYVYDEYLKLLNYDNTTCKVNSSNFQVHSCTKGTNKNRKTTDCYSLIWKVYHGKFYEILATIEGVTKYDSHYNANRREKQYEIDKIYPCWYDRRDRSIAQWEKPNLTRPIFILGSGIIGTILTILFTVPAVILVKRERSQGRNKTIPQSDGTHIQLKSDVDTNIHF